MTPDAWRAAVRARHVRETLPRDRYEQATAQLRHTTKAAWVRWEDLPVDARLTWEKP